MASTAAEGAPSDRAEPGRQRTLADALIEGEIEVAAWVPDKRLAPIGARLAGAGIPLRTLPREEEVAGHVRTLDRPALLEVRCDERAWPGPSPFVDAPVMRWRFEQAASSP